MEKSEPVNAVGGNANWYSHCEKQYGGFFNNIRVEFPCQRAIPVLWCIYPK
jgi:hypothetical protein